MRNYEEGGGFAVLPGIFHLTRVNNKGAAFGMFRDYGGALIVISVICIIFLAVYLLRDCFAKQPRRMTVAPIGAYAWSLVLAGALGNLYDRLRYGYVVDYLDFRVWPVFNLSDASICVGTFLVVLGLLAAKRKRREG